MSETRSTDAASQRFALNAPPPVRPLAIAAGSVVVGAALLVLWQSRDLALAVAGLAGLLVLLGVALALAALVLTARLRTVVRLDAEAITVVRRGEERSLAWREVKEVSLAHPRLSLRTGERGGGLVLVNPRRPDDQVFAALVDQVRQRLDGDRGYSDSPFPAPPVP